MKNNYKDLIKQLEEERNTYISIAKSKRENSASPFEAQFYQLKAEGIQLAIRVVYDWIDENG